MADIGAIVRDIAEEMAAAPERGRVADYIPPLAAIDPGKFGIAVIEADGTEHVAGDADEAFLDPKHLQGLLAHPGAGQGRRCLVAAGGARTFGQRLQFDRPTGDRAGIPRNPFINAGAIVVSDVLLGRLEPREDIGEFLRFIRSLAGDDAILMDEHVARAEQETGFRNAALANYMRAFGNLTNPIERRWASISTNARSR
jgi:glutaminase